MLSETEQAVELRRRVLAGEVAIFDPAVKHGFKDDDAIAQDVKELHVEIAKIDDRLGIVFGYAMVCSENGDEYYDVQGDNIAENGMLVATSQYMAGPRIAKLMHQGDAIGQIVYGFPLTHDIAASLNINIAKSGFVIGMRPDDDDVMQKFRTGELTGFSIGGRRIAETVVEE